MFNLPVEEAGEKLGVGLTVLKSICRKYAIDRWPYRKVRRIQWLYDRVKGGVARPHCYRDIKKLMEELRAGPHSPVWESIGIDYADLHRQIDDILGGTGGGTAPGNEPYRSPEDNASFGAASTGGTGSLGHDKLHVRRLSDGPSLGLEPTGSAFGPPLGGSRQSSDTQAVRCCGGVLHCVHTV